MAQVLRETMPELQVFAVEPEKSPVLSGGEPSPHKIQGIGAGFVPEVLDRSLLTDVVQVSEEEAFAMARRSVREEGIWIGPSSGASLAAVARVLPRLGSTTRILTYCYDTGERYLSVKGLFPSE